MNTPTIALQAVRFSAGASPSRRLIPGAWMAAMLCALAAGCATPPPPAQLDLGRARIVPMSASPALDVSGLPGGKAAGAAVGAGSGSGYGALIGGAACAATGPFFALCLAAVLPATTAIGAVSGAAIGAARTESVGAIEAKTKALGTEMAATPYNDLLARQLQTRLPDAAVFGGGASAPAASSAMSLPEIASDRPWTIEVGVTEVGTEGKREFALRLVTIVRISHPGTARLWQTAKEVQSDTELTIDQWMANDAAAMHEVLDQCLQQAARQLGADIERPARDASGRASAASKYSTSCADRIAPPAQASAS